MTAGKSTFARKLADATGIVRTELDEVFWSASLEPLTEADLTRTITIRTEPHSVMRAINRQVAHYAHHVGQILFLAKHLTTKAIGRWESLSIPRGKSAEIIAQGPVFEHVPEHIPRPSPGQKLNPTLVKNQSELVSQVVVIGAGRKQAAALIVPDWEALMAAMSEGGGSRPASRSEWVRDPDAVKIVQREVMHLTKELHDYERVRRVALLPAEFSIDSGEMTPTLKIKRRVVDEKYRQLIEELYSGGE